MAFLNFDDTALDLDCPHCGHQLAVTIGRAKKDPVIVCPSCEQATQIDLVGIEEAEEAGRKIDDAIDGFTKALDDFGKG